MPVRSSSTPERPACPCGSSCGKTSCTRGISSRRRSTKASAPSMRSPRSSGTGRRIESAALQIETRSASPAGIVSLPRERGCIMGRVEAASGTEGSAEDQAAFREVRARLGQAFFAEKTQYPPSDLFGPLLHAPRVALKVIELGGSLRNLSGTDTDAARTLPDDFAEFVAFVVFTELESDATVRGLAFAYRRPMLNHVPRAIQSGV